MVNRLNCSAHRSTSFMTKYKEERNTKFGNAKLKAPKSSIVDNMTSSADVEYIT